MTEWAAVSYLLPAAISWIARPSVECVCRFESDHKVLAILERQLDRCGPENLSRPCDCYGVQVFILGIFVGGFLVVLLKAVWSRGLQGWNFSLPVRRTARDDTARSPTTELALTGVVTPNARLKP